MFVMASQRARVERVRPGNLVARNHQFPGYFGLVPDNIRIADPDFDWEVGLRRGGPVRSADRKQDRACEDNCGGN